MRVPHPHPTAAPSSSSPWPPAVSVQLTHSPSLHPWPLPSLPRAIHEVFGEERSSLRSKLLALSTTARAKAARYLCRPLDGFPVGLPGGILVASSG